MHIGSFKYFLALFLSADGLPKTAVFIVGIQPLPLCRHAGPCKSKCGDLELKFLRHDMAWNCAVLECRYGFYEIMKTAGMSLARDDYDKKLSMPHRSDSQSASKLNGIITPIRLF
jgi:hypothetical protein